MRAPDWLLNTVNAVRELMVQRLARRSLEPDAQRDVQLALEELDVMWEELQAQAVLLSREHRRYAEFFEFAPDAHLITDAGGNIREANRAAAELLGAGYLPGRPLAQFVLAQDRMAFLSALVGAHAGRSAWQLTLRTPSGKALPCEIGVRSIPLERSGGSGLCWLIRPV
jgi:PAS domain S-box-containing protein